MKQFRNKSNGKSAHIYEQGGQWFVKHTSKGQWVRRTAPIGPFKDEGAALLSLATSADINFCEYSQVYP